MVAGTVCFVVIGTGAAVVIVEIVHPEADTTGAAKTVSSALSALIALLAGFLAGRTSLGRSDKELES